jgi:hypothetical protein
MLPPLYLRLHLSPISGLFSNQRDFSTAFSGSTRGGLKMKSMAAQVWTQKVMSTVIYKNLKR